MNPGSRDVMVEIGRSSSCNTKSASLVDRTTHMRFAASEPVIMEGNAGLLQGIDYLNDQRHTVHSAASRRRAISRRSRKILRTVASSASGNAFECR
jgi:hypothetical protein